jgi:hypothetical protein
LRGFQNLFRGAQESIDPHHDALAQNGTRLTLRIGFCRRIGHQVQADDTAYDGDPANSIAKNLLFHARSSPGGEMSPVFVFKERTSLTSGIKLNNFS